MADFNPVLKGYSGQTPFRFWCQTVMPLVYDESLSYYELLCKIMKYLNNTIQDVANTEDNVSALAESYSKLQDFVNNYFDSHDFQEMVEDKIDEMVQTGVMDELVGNQVAALINQTVAGQIDGSVAGQIGSVVGNQIGGVVAEQLPDVVEEQIGEVAESAVKEAAENWLEENITNPPIDKTLKIKGAASDSAIVGGLVLGDNPMQPIACTDDVKYSTFDGYNFSDFEYGLSGYGFTEFREIANLGGVSVKILKTAFNPVVIRRNETKRFRVYVDMVEGAQIAPTIRIGFTYNTSLAGIYADVSCPAKGVYEFDISNITTYTSFNWVYVGTTYASDLFGVYVYEIGGMIDELIGGNTGGNNVVRSGDYDNDVVINDTSGLTTATGGYSTAEGLSGNASGMYSHAEGYSGQASGADSHVEGYGCNATGNHSHAEGNRTTASGLQSHSEGGAEFNDGGGIVQPQIASGDNSHVEGKGCEAYGPCSHAEGRLNRAIGENSHAEGRECTAYGENSHAGGVGCYTSGDNSFVHGKGIENYVSEQVTIGKYNQNDSDALFVVGNGTEENNIVTRKNAFSIMKNGDMKLGNTTLTELQLQDLLSRGSNETFVTLTVASDSSEGVLANEPVKMVRNMEVDKCTAGMDFCGFSVNAAEPGETVVVKISGLIECQYTQSNPNLGHQGLNADGLHGVKAASGGRKMLIVSVDDTTNVIKFYLYG